MENKKGAIELSVTTIIVIVLGVALLSLGLVFVRNIFEKTEGITKDAFTRAEAEIGKVGQIDSFINIIPPKIEIEQRKSETVDLILANLESSDITVRATVSSKQPKLACAFSDTLEGTSKEYTLSSGDTVKLHVYVEEKGGSLGIKVCNIDVSVQGADIAQTSDQLIINVIRK